MDLRLIDLAYTMECNSRLCTYRPSLWFLL